LPDLLAAEGTDGGLDALCELLVRASELAIDSSISELDFNPVMVSRDDVTIVDAPVRTGDVDTETEDDDTR